MCSIGFVYLTPTPPPPSSPLPLHRLIIDQGLFRIYYLARPARTGDRGPVVGGERRAGSGLDAHLTGPLGEIHCNLSIN